MSHGHEPYLPANHPLAGVLDRLLARERGSGVSRLQRPFKERPRPAERIAVEPGLEPARRRMLVIAGLGSDEGCDARRFAALWGLQNGRHPAALDIACGDGPFERQAGHDSARAAGPSVPLASIPCGLERLREEPSEGLAALLERLRRHETAADLLIVRISPRHKMALMRAAFLAGGLILPVENTYSVLYEAFQLSREALENFLDLALWPFPRDEAALLRYQSMMRDFLDVEPAPFEHAGESSSAPLDRLSPAPDEGFLVSLVDPETTAPPAQLMRVGALQL